MKSKIINILEAYVTSDSYIPKKHIYAIADEIIEATTNSTAEFSPEPIIPEKCDSFLASKDKQHIILVQGAPNGGQTWNYCQNCKRRWFRG